MVRIYQSSLGIRAFGGTVNNKDAIDIVAGTIPTNYDSAGGISVSTSFTTIREAMVTRSVIGGVCFAVSAISGGTVTVRAYRQLPAGTVAAPTFTGNSNTTSAVSAGTPTGTNSAPAFTGTENQLPEVANGTDLQAATGASGFKLLIIGI